MADERKRNDERKFPVSQETPKRRPRRPHWGWSLGLAAAGVGSAAAFMLRGCWHLHMTWPQRYDDEFSYQVCPGCGIKRLFNEKSFHAYGPYGYDVEELIARERALRIRRMRRHEELMKARREKKKNERRRKRNKRKLSNWVSFRLCR